MKQKHISNMYWNHPVVHNRKPLSFRITRTVWLQYLTFTLKSQYNEIIFSHKTANWLNQFVPVVTAQVSIRNAIWVRYPQNVLPYESQNAT